MSKTLGEKEAWAVAKAQGLSVATILPEFVMGPALTLSAAESSISAGFFKVSGLFMSSGLFMEARCLS